MLPHNVADPPAAIDRLVYELPPSGMIYGLFPDEIIIVEGKG